MKKYEKLFNNNYIGVIVNETVYNKQNLMLASGLGIPHEWVNDLDGFTSKILNERGLLKFKILNGDRSQNIVIMKKHPQVFNGEHHELKTSIFQAIARWDNNWTENWEDNFQLVDLNTSFIIRKSVELVEPELIKYLNKVEKTVSRNYRTPNIERLYKHTINHSKIREAAIRADFKYPFDILKVLDGMKEMKNQEVYKIISLYMMCR